MERPEFANLYSKLTLEKWDFLEENLPANTKFGMWLYKFINIYNSICINEIKTLENNKKPCPWITTDLKK